MLETAVWSRAYDIVSANARNLLRNHPSQAHVHVVWVPVISNTGGVGVPAAAPMDWLYHLNHTLSARCVAFTTEAATSRLVSFRRLSEYFMNLYGQFYVDCATWMRRSVLLLPRYKRLREKLLRLDVLWNDPNRSTVEHALDAILHLFLLRHRSTRRTTLAEVTRVLHSLCRELDLTQEVRARLSHLAMDLCIHQNSRQMMRQFVAFVSSFSFRVGTRQQHQQPDTGNAHNSMAAYIPVRFVRCVTSDKIGGHVDV